MKPDVDRLLEVSAVQLMTGLGPALPTGYQQSSAGALGAMLLALREEFERGASRRAEENAELRRLFDRAGPIVADAGLRERLRAASASGDPGLEISRLEAENGELRGLLVELHAHVETLDTEAARALDDAIWKELARSTERRRLSLAVF